MKKSLIYKEMVYGKEHIVKILCQSQYNGYDFLIVNLGTHPTAYIRIPEDSLYCYVPYYSLKWDKPNPHGNFTFSRNSYEFAHFLDEPIPEGWWLGWDYFHPLDYNPYTNEGKQWSTEEIIDDCKATIDLLKQ